MTDRIHAIRYRYMGNTATGGSTATVGTSVTSTVAVKVITAMVFLGGATTIALGAAGVLTPSNPGPAPVNTTHFGCDSSPCLYGGTCVNTDDMGGFNCTCQPGLFGSVCQDEVHCDQFGPEREWTQWEVILDYDPLFNPGQAFGASADKRSLWISGVRPPSELFDGLMINPVYNASQFIYQFDLFTSTIIQIVLVPFATELNALIVPPTNSSIIYGSTIAAIANSTLFYNVTTDYVVKLYIGPRSGGGGGLYNNDSVLATLPAQLILDSIAGDPDWPAATELIFVVGFAVLSDGNLVLVLYYYYADGNNAFTSSHIVSPSLTVVLENTILPTARVGPNTAGYALYNRTMYYINQQSVFSQRDVPPLSPTDDIEFALTIPDAEASYISYVSPFDDLWVVDFDDVTFDYHLVRIKFTAFDGPVVYGTHEGLFGIVRIAGALLSVTPWRTAIFSHFSPPFLTTVACNCTGETEVFFNTRCIDPCSPNPCGGGMCVANVTSLTGYTCE